MDDDRFWLIIENSWQAVGDKLKWRQQMAEGKLSAEKAEELINLIEESLNDFISAFRKQLNQLSAADLLALDRILERKLYDIDRAEIQEHTDGSDDGFLYARGFIVAAGKAYYDAVNVKPSFALMDLECEEICYLSLHLYEDKYGDVSRSDISRESCSNRTGWADSA
jgi:Protein of unknown function (DUF4240)